jgi:signal transduction histidine kinase
MLRRRAARSGDQGGALLDHVLDTIDGERQQIAHRLHDGPQQLMTAIRLVADGARHALEQGDSDQARQGLERLEQMAAEAADELRRMSAALHPVVMEQRGLRQALAALTETLEEEHELRATFTDNGTWPAADPARDRAVYQIARESALAAARGGAASISILLAAQPGSLRLTVRSHGRIDPGQGTLLLLAERARRIDAALVVRAGDPLVIELTAPTP